MNQHEDEQIENKLKEIESKSQKPKAKQQSTEPPVVIPNNPRIASVKPPRKPCKYSDWQAIIQDNFPDLFFSAEICLAVISQILITDITNPFALVLVDVPSAGKTITLNFFAQIEQLTYTTDKFSPASFVSNAANVKKEKLAEVDLLPRLKNKTFIVRDLATIFSKRDDDLSELLGILTRVMDGEGLNTESGVHGARHYTGEYLFMFLAASTPISPRVWSMMGSLGSRLFFLNINSKDKSDDELADQLGSLTYKDKEKVCRAATQDLLYTLWSQYPKGIKWTSNKDDRELKKLIAKCARLLARLRGVVNVYTEKGDDGTQYSYSTPVIEKPDRINQLLYNLCRGHAVGCGRTYLTRDDLRFAIELAVDSAPTTRTTIFRHLLESGGELFTTQVEQLLNCSKPTAGKEMEKLRILGLCTKTHESGGFPGGSEIKIVLSKSLEWFMSNECKEIRGIAIDEAKEANKGNLTLWDPNDPAEDGGS